MLMKTEKVPAKRAKVDPIIGRNQKAFLVSEMSKKKRDHFLKAKAPEHSAQFNHEYE